MLGVWASDEQLFRGLNVPMLSSSFWILSLTMSSACCRMCMASSMVQFSRRTLSMASSLSPGSRVPVLPQHNNERRTNMKRVQGGASPDSLL